MTRGRWAFLAVAVQLAAAPGATAQDSDRDRARALFTEGVALVDQGQHQRAVAVFEEALTLHDAPAIRFNLGTAYYELGRYGRAADQFEAVRNDRSADRQTRRRARQTLRDIEPSLGTVTVVVEGDIAGTTLALDGWEIPAERIGTPLRASGGDHRVTAERDGRVGGRSVEVTAGENVSITLRLGASPRSAAMAGLDDEALPREDYEEGGGASSGSLLERWWFWTAVGAFVVGAVVIGILVTQSDDPQPIQGDLDPPFVEILP